MRCLECSTDAPFHKQDCAMFHAEMRDRAETYDLRRREVEAQERLALATQFGVLREIRAAQAGDPFVSDESKKLAQAALVECFRRLNELTQPPAPDGFVVGGKGNAP